MSGISGNKFFDKIYSTIEGTALSLSQRSMLYPGRKRKHKSSSDRDRARIHPTIDNLISEGNVILAAFLPRSGGVELEGSSA